MPTLDGAGPEPLITAPVDLAGSYIAFRLGPSPAPRALPLRLALPLPSSALATQGGHPGNACTRDRPPRQAPHGPHARRKRVNPASGLPSRGGRCQVGIRGPVRKQHEGFRRRKRGSAPQLRNPPHCHVRQRIARGARTSWPIRSRRTRVPEGSSHSRPGEGV